MKPRDERWIVSVGIPLYRSPDLDDLPAAIDDARKIADFFKTRFGYREWPDQPSDVRNVVRFKDKLGRWLESKKKSPPEHLVLYWAGHADVAARKLVLIGAGGRRGNLSEKGLTVGNLMSTLLRPGGPRRTLLVLDVCYAGPGAHNAMNELHDALDDIRSDDAPLVAVLASTNPRLESW